MEYDRHMTTQHNGVIIKKMLTSNTRKYNQTRQIDIGQEKTMNVITSTRRNNREEQYEQATWLIFSAAALVDVYNE